MKFIILAVCLLLVSFRAIAEWQVTNETIYDANTQLPLTAPPVIGDVCASYAGKIGGKDYCYIWPGLPQVMEVEDVTTPPTTPPPLPGPSVTVTQDYPLYNIDSAADKIAYTIECTTAGVVTESQTVHDITGCITVVMNQCDSYRSWANWQNSSGVLGPASPPQAIMAGVPQC